MDWLLLAIISTSICSSWALYLLFKIFKRDERNVEELIGEFQREVERQRQSRLHVDRVLDELVQAFNELREEYLAEFGIVKARLMAQQRVVQQLQAVVGYHVAGVQPHQ